MVEENKDGRVGWSGPGIKLELDRFKEYSDSANLVSETSNFLNLCWDVVGNLACTISLTSYIKMKTQVCTLNSENTKF